MNIEDISKVMYENRNANIAPAMEAYMKYKFTFLGIKAGPRKDIFRDLWKQLEDKSINNVSAIAFQCWQKEEREFHHLGMEFIKKIEKKIDAGSLELAEYLITHQSWWDTVDFLASHMVGVILKNNTELKYTTIEKWMDSNNMWLQRSCMIFQLFYREHTDFDLMKSCILELKSSNEFFIKKGAGWALRQYSKTDPQAVQEFITTYQGFSNLTIREASKYL